MTPTFPPFAPPAPPRGHPFRFGFVFFFLLALLAAPLAQAQTAKSRSALYTEIDTNLPSTTGAITAAVLRAQLKNVVASAYNTVNADAQPIDADLTAIAALTTATYGRSLLTLADAAALRTTAALVIGTDVQAFDAELASIAALSSNGLIARTGAGTSAARTLTGTAAEITVTNGDGAAGNPTLSLPAALTFTGKTITGGTFASPTLTTPALGTPASGVGTNLTALNATQLTTGTIPAARLPTALTSINSITAATTTDLTLAGGSSGASLALGQGTTAGNVKAVIPSTNTTPVFSFIGGPQTTNGAITRLSLGGYGFAGFESLAPGISAIQTGVTNFSHIAIDSYTGGSRNEVARFTNLGNVLIGGTTDITGTGGLKVFGSTAASGYLTGALQVLGGAGLNGALWADGTANSALTGAGLVVRGGNTTFSTNIAEFRIFGGTGATTAIAGDGSVRAFANVASTNTTTGSIVVGGGIGVNGAGYFGGALTTSGAIATVTGTTEANLILNATSSTSGLRVWNIQSASDSFKLRLLGDAFTPVLLTPLTISSTGAASFSNTVTSPAIVSTANATVGGIYSFIADSANAPRIAMRKQNGSLNQKLWDIEGSTDGTLLFRAVNDADNVATNYMTVVRSGTTISGVTFPAGIVTAPQYNSTGLGNNQFDGVIRFSTPTTVGNAAQVWTGGNGSTGGFFNVPTSTTFSVGVNNVAQLTVSGSASTFAGAVTSTNATGGLGYGTGAGGTVTQLTSRTTGVTLNKVAGAITLFTAAGSATAASFTVTNSAVAATDTIVLSVKSATNKYLAFVTATAAGSFEITFYTTGGTASDAPVINFAVLKSATS